MSNYLQIPFQDLIGEKSPVQQALKCLRSMADKKPMPNANTDQSKSAVTLLLTHLLGLCDSAGLINCRGYHSVAITIFRPIEDATDCLAAVALDANAARKWTEGNLKSSDAAKMWTETANLTLPDGVPLGDYRREIRHALNNYSHCTPNQAHWNVYLESLGEKRCTMELNTRPLVINLNAYYIDQYLCVHVCELIEIVLVVFSEYLISDMPLRKQIEELKSSIGKVVIDFLEFIKSDKIDVSIAPEIARLNKCEETS
ncbi:hypothetical protein [Paenibacillus durus]|uniref:Uncharacterized protein n=1 Tax=Paenibacillus durus ATCC 35681 TaxID=1333534 RepID=A0A0F7F7I3_PAEDU|nr:hypothetical protein [Paenibacillus durus]AKG33313.1 hypothetical protein VK70_00715 [Paenibacillus durus ATCC 35681]